MIKKWTVALFILSVLLTGCGNQRILERIGFLQITTYDLLPDGNLTIAILIPKADPDTAEKSEFLSTVARSSKEAKIHFSKRTNLLLVSGQLRNALFGESLAKAGLWNHIDTLIRDPSISPQVKISLVNGKGEEMIKKKYPQHPQTGKYIDLLIEKESAWQVIPKTTLYSFTRDYFDDGIDPVAPVIKDDGESVAIDGIALFRDDKYIVKIPVEEGIIFAFLKGDFKEGEIRLDLSEGSSKSNMVMMSSLVSARKIDVKRNALGKPVVNITVEIKGSVLEYTGKLKLSQAANRLQLERQISTMLSNRAMKMVELTKKNNVDSLGIGMHVRNHMSFDEWKQMDWDEEYPKVQINCNVKLKIKHFGEFR